MRKTTLSLAIAALGLAIGALAITAWADDAPAAAPASTTGTAGQAAAAAPAAPKWSASGQLGLVIARGNTDTQTENAKIEVTRTTAAGKDDLEAEELYGKTAGFVTAERWATTDERDWNLSSRIFTFANLHYEEDLFSGFAYQGDIGGGLGYKIIDSASTELSVQGGLAWNRLRPEQLIENALGEVTERIEQPSETEAGGTAKLHFQHAFNAQTKLVDDFSTVAGHLNTYMENDLAVQVKLGRALSLSLGYTLRNNSNPPAGLKRTDTLTTVNLVYSTK